MLDLYAKYYEQRIKYLKEKLETPLLKGERREVEVEIANYRKQIDENT